MILLLDLTMFMPGMTVNLSASPLSPVGVFVMGVVDLVCASVVKGTANAAVIRMMFFTV